MRATIAAFGVALLVAASTAAASLAPAEVLVVANSSSEDSVAVAQSYARARGIPADNVLLIPMPTIDGVSRADYEKFIRHPVREALSARKDKPAIRCVCLIYGVPLRISADGPEPRIRAACYRYLRESQARLSRMLAELGSPAPRAPAGVCLCDEVSDLVKLAGKVLTRRLAAAADIKDALKREVVSVQLVEAQRDLYGLRGLADLLPRQKLEGAPPLDDVRRQLVAAEEVLGDTVRLKPCESAAKQGLAMLELAGGMSAAVQYAREQIETLKQAETDASVDSELALASWDVYELGGPLPNPLSWRNAPALVPAKPVIMTSRIDGPSRGDALRIIKNSLSAEANGLRGTCYIDAGGPYKDYDYRLRQLYKDLKAESNVPVVYDDSTNVYAPRSCPEAALYVGWHSPQRYVPSMMWVPGAVGWHIAGREAFELHDPESLQWCPQMIRNGVAATMGATAEPTLGAFPVPADFFGLLLTGKFTVAECYWRSVGHVSWRMILIADPLYNPYAANPQVKVEELPKGMAP